MTSIQSTRETNRRPFLLLLLIMGWFVGGFRFLDGWLSHQPEMIRFTLFVVSACFPVWILMMTTRLYGALHNKGYDWIRMRDAYVLFINLNRARSYIPDHDSFLCIPGARDRDLDSLINVARQVRQSGVAGRADE